MMSPIRPILAVAKTDGVKLPPQVEQVVLADMRQDEVLRVGHADLAEAVAVGQIGQRVHLLRRDVAGNAARRLQRDGDDGVAGRLVGGEVHRGPAGELRVLGLAALDSRRSSAGRVSSGGEAKRARMPSTISGARVNFGRGRRSNSSSTSALNLSMPKLVDQDLDARLVDVVAPAVLVIDAQDRFQIGREVLLPAPTRGPACRRRGNGRGRRRHRR